MVLVPVAVAYIGGKYLIKEGDQILEATKEEYDNAIEQGAIIVE